MQMRMSIGFTTYEYQVIESIVDTLGLSDKQCFFRQLYTYLVLPKQKVEFFKYVVENDAKMLDNESNQKANYYMQIYMKEKDITLLKQIAFQLSRSLNKDITEKDVIRLLLSYFIDVFLKAEETELCH